MEADTTATDASQFLTAPEGTRVRVTYTDSYRGRTHQFEGTVVRDPFMHRRTPDGALDLRVTHADSPATTRRVADGRLRGLHHATRRHDHFMGSVTAVEAVDADEEAR